MDLLIKVGFFILGGVAVLIYQLFQSKEVLKQTLYKEKLTIYDQVVKCVTDLSSEIRSYYTGQEEDRQKLKIALLGLYKLMAEKSYLMPDELYNLVINFSKSAYNCKTVEDNKKLFEQLFYDKIVNEIRSDLGIKELSSDLLNLYSKFPTPSLLKSTGK